ncbi:PD40 domain-containing protein [bacterium]|nr:PD40 domain-containing protein [candidate division CSSED10-310 bacterium]
MNRHWAKKIMILSIMAGMLAIPLSAYGFGKNKINYETFAWLTHVSDHFEFYYYAEEQDLMPDVIEQFEKAYARISHDLGTDLSGRTPVILYLTHRHFEQTNILSGFIPTGVGGFNEPIKRRIVIPLEGSKSDLESLIIHELVHSFQFEILFQNRYNRISPTPLWIMEGLAEYLAEDWDAVGRMVLRDAVINNLLPSLSQMETFSGIYSAYLGYKASQSAIDYLRKQYGIDKIRQLYWEMRKTLRTQNFFAKAVRDTFDIDIRQLSAEWQEDLRRRIIELERRREGISSFDLPVETKSRFARQYSPVFSPGGELVAYIGSGPEGLNVYLGNRDPEKPDPVDCLTCNLNGFKYRQFVLDGRPLHGNQLDGRLAYFNNYENKTFLSILDPVLGGLSDFIEIEQDNPTSPCISPDGTNVIYAAWEEARSDIFVLDLKTLKSDKVTDDGYVDEMPCWSPDGRWIVYSTERDEQFELYRVSLSGGDPEPMVLSPGNETEPIWSPDGRWLAYISDRVDGVRDPYLMEVETGHIRRLAAPTTGMFTPAFSPDTETVSIVLFYAGSQHVAFLPVDREPRIPEVAQDAPVLGIEGETDEYGFPEFEPAGEVPESVSGLDSGKAEFKLIPDVAVGQISYGSDNDLGIEGGVILSDILGDHRFTLLGIRRGNRNGMMLSYLYLKNRIDYGLTAIQDSDFYYLYDFIEGRYYEIAWDYLGAQLHAEYPFTTFYRAELDYGYFRRNYETDLPGYADYEEKASYVQLSFVGDTAIYRPLTDYYETYDGYRFRVAVSYPLPLGDDYEDYINTHFDFRYYLPLTDRSLIAVREWGVLSSGDPPQRFGVGGYETIRGYDYNTLVGNNVALTNIELRFPIIDILRFPFGLAFTKVRGKVFADAGMIWSKGEDEKWRFNDPDTPELEGNIYGGAGWGINFWFIGVEWHFEFARKTDFSGFGGDWVYQWSIRRSF